ncbi:MAG TPA: hypothetical protein VFE60_28635 [Roseiarcus sp.]|jgi:hypothetical protein|nr:hypothetical protein [Roseiarcus sp.]
MSCPVGQDHVTLALASFPIGLAAMVAATGPRRRLVPAGGLPGDVGAIAASPTPFAFKVGVYGVFSTESALRGRPALDEGSGLPWHSPLVAALRLALPRAPPGGRHGTTPAIIGDMARVKAEIESAQINAQTLAAKAKADIAAIQMKNQAAIEEHRMRLQQMQLQAQMDAHKLQSERQVAMQKLGMQHQLAQTQATADQQSAQASHALEQDQASQGAKDLSPNGANRRAAHGREAGQTGS